jgi:hypothetical protein
MNIGVPGRTGHDFDNQFNSKSNSIIWFGKPNSHSKQPTFKKLLKGETTPLQTINLPTRPDTGSHYMLNDISCFKFELGFSPRIFLVF